MTQLENTDLPLILKIIADDQEKILYRRKFALLTDSVTAAILLQQILFRRHGYGKAFWKFREPPAKAKPEDYKPGESWVEELGFNIGEFDKALKVIGTKITKGVSRKSVKDTPYPVRLPGEPHAQYLPRFEAALKAVVMYWTDSNRKTYYDINAELLGKFINCIYIDECSSLRYLKGAVLADTLKVRGAKKPKKMQTPHLQNDPKTPTYTFSKILRRGKGRIRMISELLPTAQPHKLSFRQMMISQKTRSMRLNSVPVEASVPPPPFPPAAPQPPSGAPGVLSVQAHPLWQAFSKRWKERALVEPSIPPHLEVRYQETCRVLDQMQVTAEQIRRLVDRKLDARKFSYLFWFIPQDIYQEQTEDGVLQTGKDVTPGTGNGYFGSQAYFEQIEQMREEQRKAEAAATISMSERLLLRPEVIECWESCLAQIRAQLPAPCWNYVQLADVDGSTALVVVGSAHAPNDTLATRHCYTFHKSVHRILKDFAQGRITDARFYTRDQWHDLQAKAESQTETASPEALPKNPGDDRVSQ